MAGVGAHAPLGPGPSVATQLKLTLPTPKAPAGSHDTPGTPQLSAAPSTIGPAGVPLGPAHSSTAAPHEMVGLMASITVTLVLHAAVLPAQSEALQSSP